MTSFIVFSAQYLLFLVLVLAGVVLLSINRSKWVYLAKISIIAFPLSYIIAKILGHVIYNPRPFVVLHIQPLFHHAADNGFPSDHTLLSMTLAAVFFTVNKKIGILFAVLALVIGFARVVALVHHPIDILGSIAIAILATYLSWIALQKIRPLDNALNNIIKKLNFHED